MSLENLPLSKVYVKLVEDNLSILQVSFDNALQQVEYFHPMVNIS